MMYAQNGIPPTQRNNFRKLLTMNQQEKLSLTSEQAILLLNVNL